MEEDTLSNDARQRSGRTKRARTRQALLGAADRRFRTDGWLGTRMQDVAADAGTSPATAFNHFPTKHSLIGAVFALYVAPEMERAAQELAGGANPAQVLTDHVRRLVFIARDHIGLTVSFTAGLLEYTVRADGPADPADPGDPRNAAPFAVVMVDAVRAGQAQRLFRPYPRPEDIGPQIFNTVLLRCLTRPHELPADTAEFTLTMAFGTLDPAQLVVAGADGRPFRMAGLNQR